MKKPYNSVQANSRVTVHVPLEVTFDLDKMAKITKQVLGKLGCDGCHSGRILEFVAIQEFAVNPQTLDVREVAGFER